MQVRFSRLWTGLNLVLRPQRMQRRCWKLSDKDNQRRGENLWSIIFIFRSMWVGWRLHRRSASTDTVWPEEDRVWEDSFREFITPRRGEFQRHFSFLICVSGLFSRTTDTTCWVTALLLHPLPPSKCHSTVNKSIHSFTLSFTLWTVTNHCLTTLIGFPFICFGYQRVTDSTPPTQSIEWK